MRPRIVIVGAGFGGIAAARALKRAEADILLIDRTNHHLFQPLLYQVATAALSPADIATATRVLLRGQHNATVIMAEVVGVDTTDKALNLADGRSITFDYLVLATGAAYSFFGHDEWAEHSQVLKSLDDALDIRERLLSAFERAEQCDDRDEVKRLLTFVVVKTPWRNGTTHVEWDAVDFIAKLAALVPPPRAHLTRFHGVFAPNANLRAQLTPSGRGKRPAGDAAPVDVSAHDEAIATRFAKIGAGKFRPLRPMPSA